MYCSFLHYIVIHNVVRTPAYGHWSRNAHKWKCMRHIRKPFTTYVALSAALNSNK